MKILKKMNIISQLTKRFYKNIIVLLSYPLWTKKNKRQDGKDSRLLG